MAEMEAFQLEERRAAEEAEEAICRAMTEEGETWLKGLVSSGVGKF